jgi:Holliday junction resolvase RusA-like endonuclease
MDYPILLVIDNKTLEEYNTYYFKLYPRRKKPPIEKPIPPSLNQWMIMKRPQMNNEKQKWKSFGLWLINKYGYNNLKLNDVIITFTYYFNSKRRHDPDNYAPKFAMDFLVESGLLEDDNFDVVELRLKAGYDKLNSRTEILIKEKNRVAN